VVYFLTATPNQGLKVRMQMEDLAYIRQVQAGDRDAFRVLVERHSRAIFRVAYRVTNSEEDAEEIVQETFMKAYCRRTRKKLSAARASISHRAC